jgi:Holliday junction resolvase RusA-like endonuclease
VANPIAVGAVIPYPPALNNLYATVCGRRVLTKRGRLYRLAVASACAGVRPLSGKVKVIVKVYRPRKVGDLDNTFKAVLDALKGIAFHDDKQVVRIEADRLDDKARPRVEIVVSVMEPPSEAAAPGAMFAGETR